MAVGPGRRKGADGELIPMGTFVLDGFFPNPSIFQQHSLFCFSLLCDHPPAADEETRRLTNKIQQISYPPVAGVKVGDTVLLPDYGGQAVTMGQQEKETFLYSDQEILGIIESN